MKPHERDSTRGNLKEGREREAMGRTKKMVKAIEEWLRTGQDVEGMVKGFKKETLDIIIPPKSV